jgi:hypothetical protein
MVDATKRTEYEAFAYRLNAALDVVPGCPNDRGRAGWLGKAMGVSTESARKWLSGLSMPDMPHMGAVARLCSVHPSWLHANLGPREVSPEDSAFRQLQSMWAALGDTQRLEILKFARFQAQEGPESPFPEAGRPVRPS